MAAVLCLAGTRNLPVVAAGHLCDLLTGAEHAATVLTAGRLAAYLSVDVGNGAPLVVAVVGSGALVPPSSLLLPAGVAPRDLLSAGDRVVVGGGHVRSGAPAQRSAGGSWRLHPVRWTVAAQARPGRPDAAAVADLAARLAAGPVPARDVVTARAAAAPAAQALLADRPADAVRLLTGVLGLGPGTTPSGDDVAAGVLLAARSLDGWVAPDVLAQVAARVAGAALTRTTTVSAGLLADAAAGRCTPPVAAALARLAPRSPLVAPAAGRVAAQPDPISGLLALGHCSGADLATGLVAVLAALTDAPSTTHPRRRIA